MKLGRLNHVGVATPDIDAAIAFWRDVDGRDADQRAVRHARAGRAGVLRRYARSAAPRSSCWRRCREASPIAAFLQRNPLGGQHHLAFEVPDIRRAHQEFDAPASACSARSRIGAHGTPVFFVHPKDMAGTLTEIMEAPGA